MTKHDEKIKQLLAKAEEQKTALGSKPKANWQTNAIFHYPDSEFFNLNTIKDAQVLVDALAFLLERELHQKEAAKRLGVAAKDFVWNGYSVSDWEKDFRRRVEIIQWDQKKAQLEGTQKKLKALVSEEAKTEMELAEIEAQLG